MTLTERKQMGPNRSVRNVVALLLLVLIAWNLWLTYRDYRSYIAEQYHELELNGEKREALISSSFRLISNLLDAIKVDLREGVKLSPAQQNELLRRYLTQAPELRNLLIVGPDGHILADAKQITIGTDVSARMYFAHHRDAPGDDAPYFAKPFLSSIALAATTISKVLRTSDGKFAGIVLASFDSNYFTQALRYSGEHEDFESLLINDDGYVVSMLPASSVIGETLNGGPAFSRHIASKLSSSEQMAPSKLGKSVKLSVFKNISASPYIVISSRKYKAVFLDWVYGQLGQIFIFMVLLLALYRLAGKVEARDRKLAAALDQSEERALELQNYKSVVDSNHDAVMALDLQGVIKIWNLGAEYIFGYSAREVLGSNIEKIIPPHCIDEFHSAYSRVLAGAKFTTCETKHRNKLGKTLDIAATISPIVDEEGKIVGISMIDRDVTERKQIENRLGYIASHDKLTGLPNRELFYDRLSQAISVSRRRRSRLAILFMDLDGFKSVNDSYGHVVGDNTLMQASQRLLACVREADTVARLGGDEFAIILNEVQAYGDVGMVADKIISSIGEPMQLDDGGTYRVGVSVGIALFPDSGSEIDSLVKISDQAMYESKNKGKNCYTFAKEITEKINANDCWVEFTDALLIGAPLIDDQHHVIAKMLNDLNAALTNFLPHAVILEQLDAIITYVAFHFHTEERLMQLTDYPQAEDHKLEHQKLINEAKFLKAKFEQGGELAVLQWLKDWFIGHIMGSDKPMGDFLVSHAKPEYLKSVQA